MPFDFSDILGALLEIGSVVVDPNWPATGRSTGYTPPIVNGKRVVTFARGLKVLAWSDLSEATAFELGGGRLRFASGERVRVSSHLNGAWLIMEAARRVLRQGGVEVHVVRNLKRRERGIK